MTSHCLRPTTIALAAVAALVLLPSTAGATTTVSYASSTGLRLQGDGAGEGVSAVFNFDGFFEVRPLAGTIPGATLVAGSGCQRAGANVTCARGDNIVITANLGEGADLFTRPGSAILDTFINGGGGNDQLQGGVGADSIDGGPGGDQLSGGDNLTSTASDGHANDLLVGGEDNDHFESDGGGTDTMRGEGGNDSFRDADPDGDRSADLFDGGGGFDTADYSARSGTQPVTIKVSHVTVTTPDDGGPNEGDDIDGAENLIGGDGNDTIEVSNSALGTAPRDTRTLRGNRGADTLRVVNRVRTSMDGGPGRDTVIGGAAEDSIFAREGEADTITCGGALDTLKPDLRDIPISVDCENLDQSDRREGPNVGIRNASVAVGADGLLAVRLACPRSVRIGCKGALSARLESKGTRFGGGERYSLRAGRSVTVEVGLPSGQVARARRRGARVRVRSVERGLHGPKTTLRSLRSRRG